MKNTTTTTTTTTTIDTHALIDIDSCEQLASGTLADAMQEIAEWNADHGTAFASIEDFNRGQECYRIVTILDPEGAAAVSGSPAFSLDVAGFDTLKALAAL